MVTTGMFMGAPPGTATRSEFAERLRQRAYHGSRRWLAAHAFARPKDAWPQGPPGFKVSLYASGLDNPRLIRTAPNGDVFLAESRTGIVRVFRGVDQDGKAQKSSVYARDLRAHFGIAFYPPADPRWVYVANTDSVVRFPYKSGDMEATAAPETVVRDLPGGGRLHGGGHLIRDIAFS